MTNYKLTIQYDGGRYKGWQKLGDNENTIQGKLEKVLSELDGEEIEIVGCSRTDAGVHALAQIANVKLKKDILAKEVRDYLTKYLPQDIAVIDTVIVPESFHARYHAKSKTYLYKIWNREYPNPFLRKYSMHVEKKLNLNDMQEASRYFIGEHDYTAFSNVKSKNKSMVRNISSIEFGEKKGLINVRVQGDGFLYNMVRKMVGVLIEVGTGDMKIEEIPEIIQSKERSRITILAEPAGLYLEKIEY